MLRVEHAPTTAIFAPPLNDALLTEAPNAPPPMTPGSSAVLMSVPARMPPRRRPRDMNYELLLKLSSVARSEPPETVIPSTGPTPFA
jgi:hypothetical protein